MLYETFISQVSATGLLQGIYYKLLRGVTNRHWTLRLQARHRKYHYSLPASANGDCSLKQ